MKGKQRSSAISGASEVTILSVGIIASCGEVIQTGPAAALAVFEGRAGTGRN